MGWPSGHPIFDSLHPQELPLADLQNARVRERGIPALQHFPIEAHSL
ncbi:MAG: hypothetical protein HGA79_01355, partial [Anaerolineales bacterium]|nr:hypothetical protein [Anaerolineales bacterium]